MSNKMDKIQEQVASLLMGAQKSKACHNKNSKALLKLHEKTPDLVENCLFTALKRVMVIFKKERAVDRIIEFIGVFGASLCTGEDNLNAKLIRFMLQGSKAKERAVRFRACQMLSTLMNSMSEDAEIDDDVWEEIVTALVERTHDRVVCVKQQSIAALCRLQDPTDPDDPVVLRYRELLSTDPAKDVRRAVLANIGISKATLPDIIGRAADVAPDVRRQVFDVLAQKVPCRALSVAQRIDLVERGARDRDQAVRKSFSKLVCEKWLGDAEASVELLLDQLNVEDNEDAAERVVSLILKARAVTRLSEPPTLSRGTATTAQAEPSSSPPPSDTASDAAKSLYWRVACEQAAEGSAQREDLLPDGATLCRDLSYFSAHAFVQRQLLRIALYMDFADEGGRRMLSALLRSMLASVKTAESLIPDVTSVLSLLHPGDDEYCRLLLEVIADVHDSIQSFDSPETQQELKAKEAAAKKTNSAQDRAALDVLVSLQESTWTRYMLLAVNLLQNTTKSPADPEIAGLEQIILTGAKDTKRTVRNAALSALGSFCLLGCNAAQLHLPLLVSVCRHDVSTIQMTAARALFDILLVYGDELDAATCEPALTVLHQPVQSALVWPDVQHHQSKPSPAMFDLCAEGFVKLLFVNRACLGATQLKHTLLCELAAILFRPPGALQTSDDAEDQENDDGNQASSQSTDRHDRLRQCLSAFFPAYASAHFDNQAALVQVIGESLPICLGPSTDSCDEFEKRAATAVDCAGFLLHLTDSRHNPAARHLVQAAAASPSNLHLDHRAAAFALACDVRSLLRMSTKPGRDLSKLLATALILDRRASTTVDDTSSTLTTNLVALSEQLVDQCRGLDRLSESHLNTFSKNVASAFGADATDKQQSAEETTNELIQSFFTSHEEKLKCLVPKSIAKRLETVAPRAVPRRQTARLASKRLAKVMDSDQNLEPEEEEEEEEEEQGEEEEKVDEEEKEEINEQEGDDFIEKEAVEPTNNEEVDEKEEGNNDDNESDKNVDIGDEKVIEKEENEEEEEEEADSPEPKVPKKKTVEKPTRRRSTRSIVQEKSAGEQQTDEENAGLQAAKQATKKKASPKKTRAAAAKKKGTANAAEPTRRSTRRQQTAKTGPSKTRASSTTANVDIEAEIYALLDE